MNLSRIINPSIAASLAALLAALGVEVHNPIWEHVLEIVAIVLAAVGVVLRVWRSAE